MSHRIIVMQAGGIEQIGSPEELYEHPRTRFAGESLGRVNVLAASVLHRSFTGDVKDKVRVRLDGTDLELDASTTHASVQAGTRLVLTIRPERVELFSVKQAGPEARNERVNVMAGVVESCVFGGDHRQYQVKAGTHLMTVKADARMIFAAGERIFIHLPPADLTAVHDYESPETTSSA